MTQVSSCGVAQCAIIKGVLFCLMDLSKFQYLENECLECCHVLLYIARSDVKDIPQPSRRRDLKKVYVRIIPIPRLSLNSRHSGAFTNHYFLRSQEKAGAFAALTIELTRGGKHIRGLHNKRRSNVTKEDTLAQLSSVTHATPRSTVGASHPPEEKGLPRTYLLSTLSLLSTHEGAGKPIVTSRYEVMRGRQEMHVHMRLCVCDHGYVRAGTGGKRGGRIVEGSPMKGGRMSEEVRSCWKALSALIHGKEKTERKGLSSIAASGNPAATRRSFASDFVEGKTPAFLANRSFRDRREKGRVSNDSDCEKQARRKKEDTSHKDGEDRRFFLLLALERETEVEPQSAATSRVDNPRGETGKGTVKRKTRRRAGRGVARSSKMEAIAYESLLRVEFEQMTKTNSSARFVTYAELYFSDAAFAEWARGGELAKILRFFQNVKLLRSVSPTEGFRNQIKFSRTTSQCSYAVSNR
ncbi:hypothetical protein DBV15_02755 [Temnothorax longispinosus]|uniref:Uncharacterized protein n=1 Tax=Temnothorax longispinosus TaxID=300112 RepID=A0A4S2KHA2_9HYME|nr:hypothetical protein DBV15_02755 [Temnothorax longispinosus]